MSAYSDAMAEGGVRTEEQENSYELHVARDYFNGKEFRPSFLTELFYAFILADRENFELLRPVIKEVIKKYDLKCTCEEKRSSELQRTM